MLLSAMFQVVSVPTAETLHRTNVAPNVAPEAKIAPEKAASSLETRDFPKEN